MKNYANTTITVTAGVVVAGRIRPVIKTYDLTVIEHVFEFASGESIDDAVVRERALNKMDWYYFNKPEIKDVVDGNNNACNTCIFAFEGLGSGRQGTSATTNPNYHENEGYLKAMMVVTKGNKIVYVTRRASTLPDNRPDTLSPKQHKEKYGYSYTASTTLDSGIYDYTTGYHKKSYLALLPTSYLGKPTEWKGWYLNGNENDFHSGDCNGINIHASGINPKESKAEANSLGCQTIWAGEYIDFGKKVGFIKSTVANDWNDGYGVSSFMTSRLNSTKENGVSINVKYILNRDYDSKNGTYENISVSNCRRGVFYPISHDTCITQGDYKCTKC